MASHSLPRPTGSSKIDLYSPPADERRAAGYGNLIKLLDELGELLDKRPIATSELLAWERRVLADLNSAEADLFLTRSEEGEIDPSCLPEERWQSLKRILMRRKGILF